MNLGQIVMVRTTGKKGIIVYVHPEKIFFVVQLAFYRESFREELFPPLGGKPPRTKANYNEAVAFYDGGWMKI